MSKDAVAVATLFGGVFVLRLVAGVLVGQIDGLFKYCMNYAADGYVGMVPDLLGEIVRRCLMVIVFTVGPIVGTTVLLAVGVTFFQTKLLVSGESLKPKFSRVNPLQGFKRLFSLRSVMEALKGFLKISLLMYLIYNYFRGAIGGHANLMQMEPAQACNVLCQEIFPLVIQIAVAFLVLAAVDFLYQWWDFERQLKMSKQEIKEEYKQMEGDPLIKSKIKENQRKLAQSRMMQQVPDADVVVRNPTHFAVALRYKPERDPAPIVLAKGMDSLALRIVQIAEENRVAVVENVPLARALYADAQLDQEIPPEFYGEVAEVLVYVMRLEKSLEDS